MSEILLVLSTNFFPIGVCCTQFKMLYPKRKPRLFNHPYWHCPLTSKQRQNLEFPSNSYQGPMLLEWQLLFPIWQHTEVPIKNLHGNTCITGDFSCCVIFQGSVPYTFPTIKWVSTLKLFFINWNFSRFFRLWGSPNPGFSKVTCSWPERNFFCCEGYKLALKNKSTFFQIIVFYFSKKNQRMH